MIGYDAETVALDASVTVTLTVDEPAAWGVPDNTPRLENDRPVGSVVPDVTDQT